MLRYCSRVTKVIVAALILSSCASDSDSLPAEASSAEFVAIVSKDLQFSFEPLLTPEEAFDASDLVVEGTIVGARPGATETISNSLPPCEVQIRNAQLAGDEVEECSEPDPIETLSAYIDISVVVNTVYKADGVKVGDTVSVQLEVAPISYYNAVEAVPASRVLVLAVDELARQPDRQLNYPGEEKPDQFFVPFSQGLWISDDGKELTNPHADVESLGDGWGQPREYDELVSIIAETR